MTGPPPFFLNQGSGLGWYDWIPGKANIAVPNFILPIVFFSKSSFAFWFPPPKKVSGALPIKSFFLFAIFTRLKPSFKFTAKGFSE